MKRISVIITISISLLMDVVGQGIWIPFDQTGIKQSEVINISSSNTNVDFQVVIHGMSVQDTVISSVLFKRISIPGCIFQGSSGSPSMPFWNKLVAIPTSDSILVSYEIMDSLVIPNYHIYPIPNYQYDTSSGNFSIIETFFRDSIVYTKNKFIPEKLLEINKKGALREQQIASVSFSPFSYNPALDSLIVYKLISVHLSFLNPSDNVNNDVGLFGNIANNVLINYSLNSRPANTKTQNIIEDPVRYYSNTPASQTECDYLIITTGNLFQSDVLEEFAIYRSIQSNLEIGIVNIEDIIPGLPMPTPWIQIRNFIRDVYNAQIAPNTFDNRLAYALFVGDIKWNIDGTLLVNAGIPPSYDLDPGSYVHYPDPLNPPQTNDIFPNDYFYSCVTLSNSPSSPFTYDEIGDIFIGRIPVDNEEDLSIYLNKMMYFENEASIYGAVPVNNYVNTNLNENYFNPVLSPDPAVYTFMEYLNDLYELPYQTINPFWPPASYVCQSENLEPLSDGILLYYAIGHSYNTALLYCDPQVYFENMTSSKYPFCIAHACEVGWYDNKTDPDCFAEMLTSKFFQGAEDKGFVGCISSSRNIPLFLIYPQSSSDPPYNFIEHVPYSIWHNLSTIAGEFILESKVSMSLPSSNYTMNSLLYEKLQSMFGLNYFGDPALNLMPHGGYVTVNTTIHCSPSVPSHTISAPITVKSGVRLSIEDGCQLILQDNGKLILEPGATFEIGDGVTIIGQNSENCIIVNGIIGGNGCTPGNPVPITNLTLSAFQNSSWEGLIFQNFDFTLILNHISVSDCNLQGYLNQLEVFNSSTFVNSSIIFNRTNADITGSSFQSSHLNFMNYIHGNVTVTISGCEFTNSNSDKVIDLEHIPKFNIIDNVLTYQGGTGIDLNYSGYDKIHLIEGCSITNTAASETGSWGIRAYRSMVDIINNNITNNRYGVSFMNQSGVELIGNGDATSISQTQNISGNYIKQVTCNDNSFPVFFHYNNIDYTNPIPPNPYPLVYDIDGAVPDKSKERHMECNHFPNNPLFYPEGGYIWSQWNPPTPCSYGSNEEEAFHNAMVEKDSMNYDLAEMMLKEIIVQDTISIFPLAAAKELFSITALTDEDFEGLKMYYDTVSTLLSDSVFILLTAYLKTSCEIESGNYEEAIYWYENMIIEPPSFEDSIFSLADLGDTYLIMEADTGLKASASSGFTGTLPQYKPTERAGYKKQREEWSRLLFNEKMMENEISPYIKNEPSFILLPNFPNPCSSSTTARYYLPVRAKVILMISDVLGREMLRIKEKHLEKGTYDEIIDLTSMQPGVYFISLISNGMSVGKCKMIKGK